jgi:hypothetical protein
VSYFEVEGAGVVACVAVFDWVLAGGDEGEGAEVEGAAGVDASEVLGDVSFFSPVWTVGTSLPEDGFILSE